MLGSGRRWGIFIWALVLSGCAVHETHKDHDLIRSTLLDLYTNQIMDNLIRAANRMPIIHLDYSNASTQVTITNNIGGSDTQATTASNLFGLPAATLSATRSVMTTLMGSAGNMNANQVGLTATPVTTINDVYDAYLNYLQKPGSLVVSDKAPPPGAAHICRKVDHLYYYVPVEHRDDFFQLALATTARRGTAVATANPFFTVTLKELEKTEKNPDPGAGLVKFFKIDNQNIPQDTGTLVLDGDANGTHFSVIAETLPPSSATPGAPANKLIVYVPNQTIDLRLDEGGKKAPDGGKNLFYISEPGGKLRLYTTDSSSRTYMALAEDDVSLTPDKRGKISSLKTYIREHKLWTHSPSVKEKADVIDLVASICDYPLNVDEALFAPLPKTGKLYLLNHVPQSQNTPGPSRTESLLQGIYFNQNRVAP